MMTFNDYRRDLMDMYGAIDRKWVKDGSKLIRTDGQDNHEYFYDIFLSQKKGFFGWFESMNNFKLVRGTNVIQLNIIQRYRIFGLLESKLDEIKYLNKFKKQVKAAQKMAEGFGKSAASIGADIGKATMNQGPNPAGVIGEVLERQTARSKRKTEKPKIKAAPTKPNYTIDYELLKNQYKVELQKQLERQKDNIELSRQQFEMDKVARKSKFQKRLEEMAKKRMEDSITIEDLINKGDR